MAKKVNEKVTVTLTKNTLVEKGGAWLLDVSIATEGDPYAKLVSITAWTNPSAAKRYLKTIVLENTPRKNIKLAVSKSTPEGKPFELVGELQYKVGA
jgi:hypothetical protein